MAENSKVYVFNPEQVRPTASYEDTQRLMRKAEALRAEETARIFAAAASAIKRLFRGRSRVATEVQVDDHKLAA